MNTAQWILACIGSAAVGAVLGILDEAGMLAPGRTRIARYFRAQARARAAADDLMALADTLPKPGTRNPAPPILTGPEIDYLGELAAWSAGFSPRLTGGGQLLADDLRKLGLDLRDPGIARVLLAWLNPAAALRATCNTDGTDPLHALDTLLAVTAAAALNLTEFERATTPP